VHAEEGYLVAGRKIGLLPLTATLVMTEFNTSTLLAFSSVGYLAGIRALLLPLVFLIGLAFYALSVAKKWKELDGLSVAELFTRRYGPSLGKIASIALIIAMIGFSSTYVKSLTLIFAPLLPFSSPWIISAGLVLLVLIATLRGGLISVIRYDVVSFFLICVFLPALYFIARGQLSAESWAVMWQRFGENASVSALPQQFVFSLIILTMFTYILAPWYGQKIFAAKSAKTAKTAVALASVIVFILYGCAVIATATLREASIVLPSADTALPYFIRHYLPNGLCGLAYGLLFFCGATTLAGVWGAMASMFIGDFMGKERAQGLGLRRARVVTLVFAISSWVGANTFVDRIFQKMILANIPIAALSFALLAGFYWKGARPWGAYASTIVGVAWGIGCYFYFGEEGGYTWYWAVGGIPMIFVVGVVGSLLQQRFEDFYRITG